MARKYKITRKDGREVHVTVPVEDELVGRKDACPGCGNQHVDALVFINDETVHCSKCDVLYDPLQGCILDDAPEHDLSRRERRLADVRHNLKLKRVGWSFDPVEDRTSLQSSATLVNYLHERLTNDLKFALIPNNLTLADFVAAIARDGLAREVIDELLRREW